MAFNLRITLIYKQMKKYTFLIVILLSLFSCVKEEIDVNKISSTIEASPSIAIPLVYGSISLNDLLVKNKGTNDVSIFVDADNLLHLKYSSVLDSFYLSDFIDAVPDQDTSVTFRSGTLGIPNVDYDFSTAEFNNNITVQSTKSLYYTLKPNPGDEFFIDSAMVESGMLKFEVNSEFKATGTYSIEMPNVVSPFGVPLSVVFNSTDQSSFSPKIIDISGYTIKLLDENGVSNKIKVVYSLNVSRSSLPITDGVKLQCVVTTQNLAFKEAYGYVGQYMVEVPLDTVKLEINKQFANGEIYLGGPQIALEIENSFGIPMRVSFDSRMKAIIYGENDIPFVINPPNNPRDIAYPLISEIGVVKTDALLINNQTSNITDIIAARPDELIFGGKFEINPDRDFTKYNFVTSDSYIKASLALDLPFDIELREFVYLDTMNMDLSETISNLENITLLELDMNLENGLPLQLRAQVYFYEQKSDIDTSLALMPTDSLIHDNNGFMIESATTQNGLVVSPAKFYQNISITGERLQALKNTKYAVIKIFIETDQPGIGINHNPIKIFSTDKFSFRIGAKASANLQMK